MGVSGEGTGRKRRGRGTGCRSHYWSLRETMRAGRGQRRRGGDGEVDVETKGNRQHSFVCEPFPPLNSSREGVRLLCLIGRSL